jgi:MSHA biogenesis protein MshJ
MKRRWLQFKTRVEALQPRERIMAFGAAVVVLVFLANTLVFGPLSRKETELRSTLQTQRAIVDGVAADIAGKARAYGIDPNEALRKRLGELRAETARTSDELRAMQKGLVPPERIAPLLESILRANGRLKLVSLKTLPVTTLADGAAPAPGAPTPTAAAPATPAAPAPAPPAAAPQNPAVPPVVKSPDLLYRHGVELTVRGSYLDMVDYMQALETLPTQLFWGKAQLDAEDYPNVRLTLTLYTLSLDQKWMKL